MIGPILVFMDGGIQQDTLNKSVKDILRDNYRRSMSNNMNTMATKVPIKKVPSTRYSNCTITYPVKYNKGDIVDTPDINIALKPHTAGNMNQYDPRIRSPQGPFLRTALNSQQTSQISNNNLFCEFETDELYAEYVKHKIQEQSNLNPNKRPSVITSPDTKKIDSMKSKQNSVFSTTSRKQKNSVV